MGNLHRIRKAFDKLSEEEKTELGRFGSGCYVRKKYLGFSTNSLSYRNYVRKLLREHQRGVALSD